jgi:hypothetical protein
MKRAIVLGSVAAALVLGGAYLAGRTSSVAHEGSPAFQALLSEAIARLDGVQQEVVATTVGEAQAAAKQPDPTMYGFPTCDRDNTDCIELTYDVSEPTCEAGMITCDAAVTCSRFYTCDSQYTCHGEETCNGCFTCWYSTCENPGATFDASPTCTGAGCIEYTFQGTYTCDGTETCGKGQTCDGWPECGGGPSAVETTTWGSLKATYAE